MADYIDLSEFVPERLRFKPTTGDAFRVTDQALARLEALDTHSTKFINMAAKAVRAWKANPPSASSMMAFDPANDAPPAELKKKALPFGGLSVPVEDEDWEGLPLKKWLGLTVLRTMYAVKDEDAEWNSRAEGREAFEEVMPVGPILNRPNHHHDELSSDAAMAQLAFSGVGAVRLGRVQDPDADPDKAVWIHDTSYLAGLRVREGFEAYGCKVFFNEAQEIVRIYWCHGKQDVRPSDSEAVWEHAKWVWRCSLLVGTTVTDHLCTVHWIVSNHVTIATRESFNQNHPLRRLLAPFTWRTVTINNNARSSLLPEGGFVHRATALVYEDMIAALGASVELFRYSTVPQLIAFKGAEGMGDDFPWATDALDLFNVIHDFVQSYLAAAYPDGGMAARPEVVKFWSIVAGAKDEMGLPLLSDESLTDLLTQFIWTVTGLHEAVGTVVEYIIDPSYMGTKIRPGAQMADVQASMQCLGVMGLTGLVMPALMEDLSHVAEPGPLRQCFVDFRASLGELADQIDERNKTRKWPCNTFNPRTLETGVSI